MPNITTPSKGTIPVRSGANTSGHNQAAAEKSNAQTGNRSVARCSGGS